ncbi:MAG: RIP metalloprotease RseP [Acidobacteria bacterium]|nr:MAG: RIP metalloprotease RseP [Acidobacteriota bacterium]
MSAVGGALLFVLAFVAVLAPLIFLHELGHFLAAKAFRVRVEVFSIGFGPRLFGFRGQETDYRVAPFPLGGYVRMAGEYGGGAASGDPRLLTSKPRWQRLAILLAGPAMNALVAVVLWWGLFMHGAEELDLPSGPPVVQALADGAPAARAGLHPGDRILRIDGKAITSIEEYQKEIAFRPGQRARYLVERDGSRLELEVEIAADPRTGIGWDGVYPKTPIAIREVIPGGPADRAGLRPGDLVLGVDGRALERVDDLVAAIKASPGRPLTLSIGRGGEVLEIAVVPEPAEGGARIAVLLGLPTRFVRYGPVAALQAALRTAVEESDLLFRTVSGLVKRELGVKVLSGPVEIARMSADRLSVGLAATLRFMAMISLQLGILNLLPIPVLDGGQILILLVEGIRRRDLPVEVKEKVMLAGLLVLLALMATVIALDVAKGLNRGQPAGRPAAAGEQSAPPGR